MSRSLRDRLQPYDGSAYAKCRFCENEREEIDVQKIETSSSVRIPSRISRDSCSAHSGLEPSVRQ
jgi:hypothetical protein